MAKKRKKRQIPFLRGERLGGLAIPVPGDSRVTRAGGPEHLLLPQNAGEVVLPGEQPQLGETLHDPRYYYSEPTAEQVQAMPPKSGPPPAGVKKFPPAPRRVIDEQDLPIIRTIPPVANLMRITSHLIDNTRTRRIDIGPRNRIDVLIWNVSNNLIWWDTSGAPSPPPAGAVQGSGAPLPGNATLGGYDGASIGINAGSEIHFWAIGTVAAAQMIIIFESSRE